MSNDKLAEPSDQEIEARVVRDAHLVRAAEAFRKLNAVSDVQNLILTKRGRLRRDFPGGGSVLQSLGPHIVRIGMGCGRGGLCVGRSGEGA